MKRNLTILIVLLGLAALSTLLLDYDRFFRFRKLEMPKKGESGPFPTDWFMQQRTWPNEAVSTDEFLGAVAQADRLSARALDDPPIWEEAGPANIGGRVTDIVGHPTDESLFYVAAASGGLYKTVNGGSSWQPVFDNAPSYSMGALALSPADPNHIYVGTGEANAAGYTYFGTGLYHSLDAGSNWEQLGLAETKFIARIAIHPSNPQTIFVAAMGDQYSSGPSRGIYRSTDGGESWARTLFVNDSTGASDIVIRADNPNVVFAATWQRMRSPNSRVVGGRGSGIYRSVDGGTNWTRLTSGLHLPADNVGRIGLAISQSSPDILYAIYADDPGNFAGIYKSIDGGDTWGRVADGNLDGMYSNFGWYFGNIRVRPDNPNHVFALGQTLWRSTDGGQSWDNIGPDVHVDFHALWFSPSAPQRMLVGSDGGVYRSINNGNSFTFLNGLPINQFYAATVDFQLPQRRYGGVQDNGTLRTLSGATDDWDHIHGGDGFYALVDPTNSQRIWAEYQWGWLERSDDGGDSWFTALSGIDLNERTNWSTPVVMDPSDPQTLYYGTSRVYRSDNRGDDWAEFSPNLTHGPGGGNLTFGTVTTIDVSPLDPTIIIAGTDDANVWLTTDGGAAWHDRSAGIPHRWVTRVVCDPMDPQTFFVTVSGFRNAEVAAQIFMSENEGRDWLNISGNLPDGPLNDVVPDPLIVGRLYAASDFGCFVSPDYGERWYPLGENLPLVPVIDLVYHPIRELTAATYGRSMYKANLHDLTLNRLPVITASSPQEIDTVLVNSVISFSISATDPDSSAISYRWLRNDLEIGVGSTIDIQFQQPEVTEHIVAEAGDGELTARSRWNFYVKQGTALDEPPLPASLLLLRSYPNPFNAVTTLEFSVPRAGAVSIDVFDETGRFVRQLFKGTAAQGTQRLRLDTHGWSSGVYYAMLEAAGERRITKLLLLK